MRRDNRIAATVSHITIHHTNVGWDIPLNKLQIFLTFGTSSSSETTATNFTMITCGMLSSYTLTDCGISLYERKQNKKQVFTFNINDFGYRHI